MPNVAAIHAAKLKQIEAYHGAECPSIVWNGATYPCLSGAAGSALKLGIGGFGADADLVVIVRYSLFRNGLIPVSQETLVYVPTGKTYRIQEVQLPQGSPFFRLSLIDPTKGV